MRSVVHFTLSFWLDCRLAAGDGGVLRRAVRRADLRLQGDYLAIVTLGFGEIVPDRGAQLV